ncbi:MAG: GNAT family N-acetyltransferase [Maribacter sp.]|uniref:GNAT family N-acetyltransferase n=1 Tax=Maribacter sp. TaxID=1897614 RepID=UPI003299CFB2
MMIQKLNHTHVDIARKIRSVFQVSYAVEADLLKAIDFPPLKRSLANFLKSKTDFYGYFQDNELAAVTEIKTENNNTHIQSLVVDPYYFRQGIGKSLISFVLRTYKTTTFSVETGLDNLPAKALYTKCGFIETKQWNTEHGLRKVRFKKQI